MKALLKRVAARVDDMSLRERAILFAAASLVLVVFAYGVLIDPLLTRQKSLVESVTRDESQLKAVRGEIEKLVREVDTGGGDPEQETVRKLERRLAQVEARLAVGQREVIAPEHLPGLLRDLLGRGRQLKLESLRLVSAAPKAPLEAQRRGVEIRLAGTYFEHLRFLAELEKLPVRLLWGSLELQTDQYPEVRLTLMVYALGGPR
jgi:MSHA biogenesis protein MshJ